MCPAVRPDRSHCWKGSCGCRTRSSIRRSRRIDGWWQRRRRWQALPRWGVNRRMAPEAIADILKQKFGDKIAASNLQTAHPYVGVAADAWPEVARFLRDDPRMRFNMLRCISSLDLLEDDQ